MEKIGFPGWLFINVEEKKNIKLELHHLSFYFYAMKRTHKEVRTHCPVANLAAEFQ